MKTPSIESYKTGLHEEQPNMFPQLGSGHMKSTLMVQNDKGAVSISGTI